LSGSADGYYFKWSISTGESLLSVRAGGDVYSVIEYKGYVFNSENLYSLAKRTDTGERLMLLKRFSSWIWCVTVYEDILFVGTTEVQILSWVVSSGEKLRNYYGHTSGVNALKTLNNVLFSASGDSTAIKWDCKTGLRLATYEGFNDQSSL
jgi:WD40 repeat protein